MGKVLSHLNEVKESYKQVSPLNLFPKGLYSKYI